MAQTWQTLFRGKDVVIISPQDWGGMWVSKHWIANELSREARVLFVEPPIWVGGLARHPQRLIRQYRQLLSPVRQINQNLFVFSPRFLPSFIGGGRSKLLQSATEVVEKLGFRDTIVLNFDVDHEFAMQFHNRVTVYYCVDPVLSGPAAEADEVQTCRKSDLVFSVSDHYATQLNQHGPKNPVHVIPHGYSFDHARRIAESDSMQRPPELSKMIGPIIGFVGSIHDSYVDVARLETIANARPSYNFVMIGPYKNNPIGADLSRPLLERIRALPNVHLLGPRHFLDVPKYVKYFDVGLVLINNREFDSAYQTVRRTLFKWLLYLAQGKPVVAPFMSEAEKISDLVYLARDDQQYLAGIDTALAETGDLASRRVEYASQFSFDKVLDRIAHPIAAFLSNHQND